jgi:type IV pilus assembly protein PilM
VVDWKKEIKLSDLVGGKKDADGDAPEAKAEGEPTSIWKKEISFGRKKAERPEPEPVVEELTPVEPGPAAVDLLQAYMPEEAPAPAPVEAPVVVDLQAVPHEDAVADVVELLAAVPAPPVAPAPPVVQTPPPVVPVAPVASAPEPVVVHPPVPAAQLPPLEDEPPAPEPKEKKEKGTPFYRRELSFGKTKEKEQAPKAEKPEQTEKPEKPKRERRSLSLSLPRPTPRMSRPSKAPKKIVGLKIGASQLAAATVSNNGHAEVLQVARTPLDPGIVTNGELRDPEQLAEALKAFFKEHGLPKRGVRLGIATNRIGVRTLEIAGIQDAKQLANAIRFRAQEALPIPIDEAVLDYQVLGETTNEEGEPTRKILLVLAYRDLIDRYVDACRKAGIQLVGIDLEAFALLRALAAPREEDAPAQAAMVAVTIGHDRTTFAVSDGRVCEFTRVLDWGGQTINVGIARALDVAPSEVDVVKRGLSLHGTDVPEGLREEQATRARDALNRQVQAFARELVSSLQFYQNQPGSLGIGEIVITGGTAHLPGLAEELQRLIGVRVRVGDPLVRVKVSKKLREPEQLGSFAVAIGLGIED